MATAEDNAILTINSFLDHDMDVTSNMDFPDLEFEYSDTDTNSNEIAELYSYTENNEFQLNVKAFEELMEQSNMPPSWQKLNDDQRKCIVLNLMDKLEVSKKSTRLKACRCMLYLVQGCWAEVQSDQEQQYWTRENVKLIYTLGVFNSMVELLNLEIENSYATNVAIRKIAVSLADSVDLRTILSILYIITEVIRSEKENDSEDFRKVVSAFQVEISNPIGDELLTVKLLGMITRFCSGSAPHFPMKKVLLLLWKITLVSLGGMQELKKLKELYRKEANLPPDREDTIEITKVMRASSPPATTSGDELINQKRSRPFRRSLIKQSSLDEQEQLTMEMESSNVENEEDLPDYYRQFEEMNNSNTDKVNNDVAQNNPDENSTNADGLENNLNAMPKLPWTPKVREKDIETFLDASRSKFIGYTLQNDLNTLAGLPQPIKEGVQILKRHKYVSLADIQIKREEEIVRNPISLTGSDVKITSAETLYKAILPNLPQYMISLLKILLAGTTIIPMTVAQSTKLGIDVNRHKEIIVKAVSAILLLFLKHFKLNHIYQFEFMAQHLVFANCVPLVLKFLNQNIMSYVGSKNVIPIMDFPACVIGDQNELTSDSLVIGDSATYSWRNIFSCINLLRVLNKLTKWKHSRIMMLVVFKSAPILKRTLKVRHAMMQLYVLKLLKMQTKYLGRQWRKSNMKTISAIYSKVRHRLNDDWAFGNDLDARPWDFQAEECTLRTCVDSFNTRRYNIPANVNRAGVETEDSSDINNENYLNYFLHSGSDCLNNINETSKVHEVQLTEEFKQNYEAWLHREVFQSNINWDILMTHVE
uniref:CSON003707 protein n=1 Tax=Culicoides sonorensis TaxID=179676 RepID=A0A336LN51_CULSO